MRLKYYVRGIKKLRVNKIFAFIFVIILVLIFSITYMYNKAVPTIMALCETSAKSVALQVTNESVYDSIKNVKYENLIVLKQDSNGRVMALNANVMEINRLSTNISSDVLNRLQNIESKKIKLPITSIFSLGLFSGYGPKITLNIIPIGSVNSKFNSEFEQAGINQTRHRIFLTITAKIRLIAPFYTSIQEYTNEITVAENIIVGEVPQSYYNITGVAGLEKKDTLNLLGQ